MTERLRRRLQARRLSFKLSDTIDQNMHEELDVLLQKWTGRLDRLGGYVWVRGVDFRFLYMSVSFAQYLGCSREEASGQPDVAFFCRSDRREYRQTDLAALTSGRTVVVPEQGTGDHEGLFFETIKIPVRAVSGKAIGTVGIAWTSPWRRIHEQVITELSNSSGKCPDWLMHALLRLGQDAAGEFSSSAVASAVGVHPDSLSRAFRRHFRVSLDGYRRWLRVASAREGILHTGSSLADVALEAGFADQSHLTREMKELSGLTPSLLRKLSWEISRIPTLPAY